MEQWAPPAWFWSLLDEARPSLGKLCVALEKLPREQLIEYAIHYFDAMAEVCEPWDGPEVDGIQFSEDDTEDFTQWVVGQGCPLWARAVAADDLRDLVRQFWAQSRTSWMSDRSEAQLERYSGYLSCRGVATPIFKAIHGGDLADELEHAI